MDDIRRKEIADANLQKSRRQDNKQHCEKILLGIRNFDDNSAKRAIWELVQNARDFAEHSHIRIEVDHDQLLFAHNGKPFNFDSLSSLVKQVSSEEKEDPNAAGQFGTGFMTTHKFSRKVIIRGSYEVDNGEYVDLKGDNEFVLDRTENDLPKFIGLMGNQLKQVDDLLQMPTTNVKAEWTEFVYVLDDDHRDDAYAGVKAALKLMPYVMTINERIEECTITVDGSSTIFKKEVHEDETSPCHTTIHVNDDSFECYYLTLEDKKDFVILPLSSPVTAVSIDDVPRWFIFFPLLGTEKLGINYIFHSERFYPEEPRDCIVLPKNNKETIDRYTHNQKVLKSMTDMLFEYLRANVVNIENGKLLAKVCYDVEGWKDDTTKSFMKELQKVWSDEFATLPFVKVGEDRVSASDSDKVRFLDNTIVEFLKDDDHKKYLDVVYSYATKVSKMPAKEDILDWSQIVYEWNPEEKGRFVTVEDIVKKIVELNDKTSLHDFLMYLKESGQTDLFKTNTIVPNRDGALCYISNLRNGENIPAALYMVAKPLVPKFTNMLVDEAYVDVFNDWVSPTREDLKTALNGFVSDERVKIEPLKDNLSSVLKFCMTFPTTNTTNTRYQAMQVICKMHNETFVANHVPNIGDVDKEQLMYNEVFDFLVEWQFKQIENAAKEDTNWYNQNADTLFDLLNALSNKERPTVYQKKMQDYAIFPSMNGSLCKCNDLHVLAERAILNSEDVTDLCDYYNRVMGEDLGDTWVDDRFLDFQTFAEDKAKENVARPIDDKLQEDGYKSDVTLEIISHLDKNEALWMDWFANINKNKAEIFLHRIDSKSLPDVYSILKDKDKIPSLAILAKDPRMDEIIKEGRKALAQADYELRHDCFIRELGDFVEKMLLEKLQGVVSDDRLKVEVSDKQGGQDYLVKLDGKAVYYVEVKSRWKKSESVEMSSLQFKTSVDEKDHYSLCYVDMTWKNIEDVGNREYDDLDTCIAHTKVLNDIGKRNERCIDSVKEAKDRTHIGGGYSLVVPQVLFDNEPSTLVIDGVQFERATDFNDLVDRIKAAIDKEMSQN